MALKLGFDVQTFYENQQLKKSDVETVRKYLISEFMPSDSDEFIAGAIICCHGDTEAAQKLLTSHFEGRKYLPELYNRRFLDEDLVKEWNVIELATPPERTSEGSVLLIMRFKDPVASHFHLDLVTKLFLMCVDAMLYEAPVKGFIFLLDLKQMSFKHFLRLQISLLRRLMKYSGDGLIHYIKNIHIINGGFVVEKVYQLFKMISKPAVFELFLCHSSNLSWEEFYQKHIPRKYLPSDYGGELESMEKLNEQLWKKLETLESFFLEEEEWRLKYEQADKY